MKKCVFNKNKNDFTKNCSNNEQDSFHTVFLLYLVYWHFIIYNYYVEIFRLIIIFILFSGILCASLAPWAKSPHPPAHQTPASAILPIRRLRMPVVTQIRLCSVQMDPQRESLLSHRHPDLFRLLRPFPTPVPDNLKTISPHFHPVFRSGLLLQPSPTCRSAIRRPRLNKNESFRQLALNCLPCVISCRIWKNNAKPSAGWESG